MTLIQLGGSYYHSSDPAVDPVETKNAAGRMDVSSSSATLQALAGRDTVAQPPTLAELQALGLDQFAIELADASYP